MSSHGVGLLFKQGGVWKIFAMLRQQKNTNDTGHVAPRYNAHINTIFICVNLNTVRVWCFQAFDLGGVMTAVYLTKQRKEKKRQKLKDDKNG